MQLRLSVVYSPSGFDPGIIPASMHPSQMNAAGSLPWPPPSADALPSMHFIRLMQIACRSLHSSFHYTPTMSHPFCLCLLSHDTVTRFCMCFGCLPVACNNLPRRQDAGSLRWQASTLREAVMTAVSLHACSELNAVCALPKVKHNILYPEAWRG